MCMCGKDLQRHELREHAGKSRAEKKERYNLIGTRVRENNSPVPELSDYVKRCARKILLLSRHRFKTIPIKFTIKLYL